LIQADPEEFEIELTDIAFGGNALGRNDGRVVFVPYALPGDRVRARVQQQRPDYAQAELVELLTPGPGRVEPKCSLFGVCGGCQWQHADYAVQLAMKRQIVVDQLRRIGGFQDAAELVRDPIGMMEPWGYRNHVRFSLGRKYGDVGFTHRGTRRLLRVDACDITHPAIIDVLQLVQRRCVGLRAHQIMVRYGCNTGDLLVNPSLPSVPELQTGQTTLTEELLDRRFTISTAAFFQVNTKRETRPIPESLRLPDEDATEGRYSMADILALFAIRRLDLQHDDVVVDAYCGVGSFTALIAPRVRQVLGIEESAAAVADAKRNTADLDNVRFLKAKTEEALGELTDPRPNALIIDPSRVGCAPQVVQALIDSHPERLVYVSCDPSTLARDLRLLRDGGYTIQQVEPIDMFPQTYHIETVTSLRWEV